MKKKTCEKIAPNNHVLLIQNGSEQFNVITRKWDVIQKLSPN